MTRHVWKVGLEIARPVLLRSITFLAVGTLRAWPPAPWGHESWYSPAHSCITQACVGCLCPGGAEKATDCVCLINHIWFCSSVLIGKQSQQGLEADGISAPLKGQCRQGSGHGETPALGSPCLLLPWGPLNGMGLSKRRAIMTVTVTTSLRLQTQPLN